MHKKKMRRTMNCTLWTCNKDEDGGEYIELYIVRERKGWRKELLII
jgi:hypothetical protein